MSTHVNLRWLLQLRWVLMGLAALLLAVGQVSFGGGAWVSLAAVLAVGLLSNALLAAALPAVRAEIPVAGAVLLFDLAGVTAFLAGSGGANNPFAFLYLLEATIGALVLPPLWTAALVVAIGAAYGSLFLLDPGPVHHDPDAMRRHVAGMWLAYAVCGPFVAYAVLQLRGALTTAEARRLDAVHAQQRSERLASLATLAAGAAHEIATPLSTIAVVAGELSRHADPAVRADGGLLVREVERCRTVLHQLAADAGSGVADRLEVFPVAALLESLPLRGGVPPEARVRGSVALLGQALRRVVTNAREAAGPDGRVEVSVAVVGDEVHVVVDDGGPGMSPEVLARVGEPFFTTRPTGRGMGLGVYFARAVAEHHGGRLALTSAPGRGTTATLILPRAP